MSWFSAPSQSWTVRLATWFGVGRLPRAPGTMGTLAAVPLIVLLYVFGHWPYLIGLTIFCYLAIEIADLYQNKYQTHDPKEVVIDEVAGYAVAMTWLPFTWQSFLYAFLIFRFLDVVKPWPIRWIDEKARGGIGVVADDLVAGIMTNVALQFAFAYTNWLGVQWQH